MTDRKHQPVDDDGMGELLRRALRDEAPPAALRERAMALRGPVQWLAARAGAALRRLVAVAVASEVAPDLVPSLGVRGAMPTGQQWLFRVEDCEIDLRVAPRGEGWVVTGQLFGAADAQRVVLGTLAGDPVASIELGPTREFGFGDVIAGRYSLTVRGGDLEVVVPTFDVGVA